MIRILIFGAGRMARSLLSVAGEFPAISIAGVVFHDPGDRAGEWGVPLFDSLSTARDALNEPIDLVIDFSLAEGTPTAARWCR